MPTVKTTVWIDAPIERVYAIAKDNRAFPEFMEDVEALEIVETQPSDQGTTVVSDWVGKIPTFGMKVRWRQEDRWDDQTKTDHFRQIKGDYDSMSGTWVFTEENGGTRFDSVLEYEYVVPGLGAVVGKVIYGLVVKNMEGVLDAIKRRAETAPAINP